MAENMERQREARERAERIRSARLQNSYARGVWYASPYIYQTNKWAVYSPAGTCVSIHQSKREAVEEALRYADAQVGGA